eukprot:SAG22_NODE_901_length_6600_cov_1.945854_4_plen_146_part_00
MGFRFACRRGLLTDSPWIVCLFVACTQLEKRLQQEQAELREVFGLCVKVLQQHYPGSQPLLEPNPRPLDRDTSGPAAVSESPARHHRQRPSTSWLTTATAAAAEEEQEQEQEQEAEGLEVVAAMPLRRRVHWGGTGGSDGEGDGG